MRNLWIVIISFSIALLLNIIVEIHDYKLLDDRITNIEMAK